MAKTDFESVDEYIAAQPGPAQAVLRRVSSSGGRFSSWPPKPYAAATAGRSSASSIAVSAAMCCASA